MELRNCVATPECNRNRRCVVDVSMKERARRPGLSRRQCRTGSDHYLILERKKYRVRGINSQCDHVARDRILPKRDRTLKLPRFRSEWRITSVELTTYPRKTVDAHYYVQEKGGFNIH